MGNIQARENKMKKSEIREMILEEMKLSEGKKKLNKSKFLEAFELLLAHGEADAKKIFHALTAETEHDPRLLWHISEILEKIIVDLEMM